MALSTIVFTVFSALALMFAATGLAALIAYGVKQRERELGIRAALGARPRDLVGLLVREGASLTIAGLAIGIPAALLVTRVLASQLFSITPTRSADLRPPGRRPRGGLAGRRLRTGARSSRC